MINNVLYTGDSLLAGVGASSAAKKVIALQSPKSQAVSGYMSADISRQVQQETPDASMVYKNAFGTNDAIKYGDNTTKKEFFERFLRFNIAHRVCIDKKLPRTTDIVYTGTPWNTTTGNNVGKWSTETGATATAIVEGNSAYVSFTIQNNVAAHGTADIYVDGIKVDDIYCFGAMNTNKGVSYATATKRITGLGAGSHSVKLEITSSGKNVYLDGIYGSDQAATPEIKVGNLHYWTPAAYSNYGGSDLRIDNYNTIIENVVNEFIADGFNISLVDLNAALGLGDLASDGLHWNDSGNEIVAGLM